MKFIQSKAGCKINCNYFSDLNKILSKSASHFKNYHRDVLI